jgi:hypothetical protein
MKRPQTQKAIFPPRPAATTTAASVSIRQERGAAYYDGSATLYAVYGQDGNWQATRATDEETLSTPSAQPGVKPTTLTALRALTYS